MQNASSLLLTLALYDASGVFAVCLLRGPHQSQLLDVLVLLMVKLQLS